MNATDLLRALQRIIEAFRKRQFNLLLAMAVVGIFVAVFKLPNWLPHGIEIPHYRAVFWIGIGLGTALFVWLCVRVARLALPRELPPSPPVPTSLKGLSAFGNEDGQPFRRLGRTQEIAVILGLALDDQVPLAVVRGQSGAGKTSLLRAGLQFTLEEDRKIPCVYWEARADGPVEGLRHALSARLGIQLPSDLGDLPALVNTSTVVIMDQFEQLRQEVTEHGPIFDFLERVIKGPPPYRLKLVVAFRDENYDSRWLDFEERVQTQARKISLKLFHPDVAEGVMATIMGDAGLEVQHALLRNYVDAVATPAGGVSPVDIGIGALVLANWAQQKNRELLSLEDYIMAGGATGILSTHVKECLNELPALDRRGVIKGLTFALIDLSRDQRIAAGATCQEIAAKGEMDAARLQSYVKNRLASLNARLLEAADDGDAAEKKRYRLTHERLVPVLRQLAGENLAEVDRTKLVFDDQYARWTRGHSHSYLISGKELRLALQYSDLILAGEERASRSEFLIQSRAQRNWRRAAVAGFALVIVTMAVVGLQQLNSFTAHKQLASWGLPPDLYERQRRLKKLELRSAPINDLHWLRSAQLRDLSLAGSHIDSLEGAAKLTGLQSLTLDLRYSQVTTLADVAQLTGLKSLTLDLFDWQLTTLAGLAQLKGLRSLTLDLSNSSVTEPPDLAQFKGLQSLTLDLSQSQITTLPNLAQLNGLQSMTLDLHDSQIATLPDFAPLKELQSLTLDLSQSKITTMPDLAQLTGLQSLTLDLRSSQITTLAELAQLTGLKSLTLLLNYPINKLADLARLKGLQSLTLEPDGSQITTLADLAQLQGLQSLTLDLRDSQITTLADLARLTGLQSLTLDLRSSFINSLADLAQLQGLKSFTLSVDGSKVSELRALHGLNSLRELTIKPPVNSLEDVPDSVEGLYFTAY